MFLVSAGKLFVGGLPFLNLLTPMGRNCGEAEKLIDLGSQSTPFFASHLGV
jgi:hypothetical protein